MHELSRHSALQGANGMQVKVLPPKATKVREADRVRCVVGAPNYRTPPAGRVRGRLLTAAAGSRDSGGARADRSPSSASRGGGNLSSVSARPGIHIHGHGVKA